MVKISKLSLMILIIIILTLTSILTVSATDVNTNEDDCIYYFYGETCKECLGINNYLTNLNENYPNLNIINFEVYFNKDNGELLQNYLNQLNIDEKTQQLPLVLIGKSYFMGKGTITSLLEERIKSNEGSECPSLKEKQTIGVVGIGEPVDITKTLTFSKVTKSALDDIFKSGSVALFLIFLVLILTIKENEKMLKRGTLFIIGIYLAYFIFGLGLLDFFYNPSLGSFFIKTTGIVMIIFALIRIKSFFKAWKILTKSFNDLKKIIKKLGKKIVSPLGTFSLGFVSSLFTFFTVSEPFILIRNLFAGGIKRKVIFPLLLYYNLIFVFGMIFILIFVYLIKEKMHLKAHKKSKDNKKKKELWIDHYHNLLNLMISLIIFILGIIILFS